MANHSSGVPTPPRVEEVRLTGLFGLFDHKIALNPDTGITIIHGANGVGKTRILQILHSLTALKWGVLRRTPFDRLELSFSDGSELKIDRADTSPPLPLSEGDREPPKRRELPSLLIRLLTREGELDTAYPSSSRQSDRVSPRAVERYINMSLPFVERLDQDTWIDEETGDELSLSEVVERYGDHLPPQLRTLDPQLPSELESFLKAVRIHFIDTQRLQTHVPDSRQHRAPRSLGSAAVEATVDYYARHLSRELERHLADYAGMSTSLDRTFPQRALASEGASAAAAGIRESYEELTALRNRLTESGLLERSDELPWPDRELNDTERQFLALYFQDTRQKLSVFATLLQKLELLSEMLDQRFLYKRLRIDRNRGFYFTSPSDDAIPPSELSSGEQHELVFAYRLLFRVAPQSLVLIDEPEISLNVAWQQRFIADLERIRQITDLNFLIATHSPQIIHDRWELAQRLGGGSE
jgi:ABC-type lipoprotein export system ATPase subunit